MAKPPIIPCSLHPDVKRTIRVYADELRENAHTIGSHGLTKKEFEDSGIFKGAIERLRGMQAASMAEKKDFMDGILLYMGLTGFVVAMQFTGDGNRHDYELEMPDGTISIIETKGCLDGNNTNIFQRPAKADEFIIWSLCQNPGSDPRHNAWSGLHTRLGAEIIHSQQKVDGVVIWDMVCGSKGRPCPKLIEDPTRFTELEGRNLPPPCIYLFPRSIPDPRDNPNPPVWRLEDVKLLSALVDVFKGDDRDIVEVHISARMNGADLERKTTFINRGNVIGESGWVALRRATR